MANSDRPRVGAADPDVRKRLLREKLDEPTRAEGVAPKPKPKPGEKPKRGKVRRVGTEGQTLEEVVSEAVDGAPKRPIR